MNARCLRSVALTLTLGVALALTSVAHARGGKGLSWLTNTDTLWVFDTTEADPSGRSSSNLEEWRVAITRAFGKAKRVEIVVTEVDPDSQSRAERQVEYVVQGDRFYDISSLEKGRRTPDLEPSDLDSWIPLLDLGKLGKDATVIRYPDNPLAYVRYEKLSSFELPGGKSYKDVVHATRNRGDTETTDEWWFSLSEGVLKIQLTLPAIAGGTKITRVRNLDAEKEAKARAAETSGDK